MDDITKDAAYKSAGDFVGGLVKRPNFRPEQMADAIDKKFPISFVSGMTTAENVANQYKRDIAMAITKVIDDKGNVPHQDSSAYKNIVQPVVDGRAVNGSGLPTWKRIEGMAERYPAALQETIDFNKATEAAREAAQEALRRAKEAKEELVKAGAVLKDVVHDVANSPAGRLAGSVAKNFNKVAVVTGTLGAASSALHAKTPEERNYHLKDMAKELGSGVPLVSSAVHKATGMPGLSPIEQDMKDTAAVIGGALSVMSNGQKQSNSGVINQQNLAITREQKFIMSDQHPGQLCALTMKGPDGKPMDVEAALRDSKQRQQVFAEIDKRAATASPQGKELFNEMKMAAIDFASLEDRHRELNPAAPQPAQPQVATVKPQSFAPA